jgi:hypothetical protein
MEAPVPASASAAIRPSSKSAPTPTAESAYSPREARDARATSPSREASPWLARPSEISTTRGARPVRRAPSTIASARSRPLDRLVPPSVPIESMIASH